VTPAGEGNARQLLLSPSILSADWTRLPEMLALAEEGADWLHLDVMDGHFVPNLTFGPMIVSAIRRMTSLPLDVHLMIHQPASLAAAFKEAGADWISFHVEAWGVAGPGWEPPEQAAAGSAGAPTPGSAAARASHPIDMRLLRGTIAAFRRTGARVGLALRPDTAVAEIEPVLNELDLVLPMSVYPGFSGQAFREEALEQMRWAARWRNVHRPQMLVQADGGVALETVERVAVTGVDVFVAGHGVYRQSDPLKAMGQLMQKARDARTRAGI
jgi:ribulose-phosphate 3-epimerase